MDKAQAKDRLRRFMEDLPPQNRLILILSAAEGMTDAEIGIVLDVAESVITSIREALNDLILTVMQGD